MVRRTFYPSQKLRKKGNESGDEAEPSEPNKPTIAALGVAGTTVANCGSDEVKIEPPNLVICNEVAPHTNAVFVDHRPPQKKPFTQRIIVNLRGARDKIKSISNKNGTSSLGRAVNGTSGNNAKATDAQQPLCDRPSSSIAPSVVASTAVASSECKAQSRLFGIALLGVGVRKNGGDSGDDANQRQQKHSNSHNGGHNECPPPTPAAECLSTPSTATTNAEQGTKMGDETQAKDQVEEEGEKPKRPKRPAKGREEAEDDGHELQVRISIAIHRVRKNAKIDQFWLFNNSMIICKLSQNSQKLVFLLGKNN